MFATVPRAAEHHVMWKVRLPEGSRRAAMWTREAALQAFKEAFMKWLNDLHPGDWPRNRDCKRR